MLKNKRERARKCLRFVPRGVKIIIAVVFGSEHPFGENSARRGWHPCLCRCFSYCSPRQTDLARLTDTHTHTHTPSKNPWHPRLLAQHASAPLEGQPQQAVHGTSARTGDPTARPYLSLRRCGVQKQRHPRRIRTPGSFVWREEKRGGVRGLTIGFGGYKSSQKGDFFDYLLQARDENESVCKRSCYCTVRYFQKQSCTSVTVASVRHRRQKGKSETNRHNFLRHVFRNLLLDCLAGHAGYSS